ncbi:hypothetical protein AVEN_8423-1 [Araneus ventricosus]|uniref:Uncharacterized protein n=1 Tax=Araneus ventricosus TaxID=182803 RepID=A0A4Y2QPJ0_ARAVE|nr:hypothetical protein AVEN_8423-1 [Araneus ventricosus]
MLIRVEFIADSVSLDLLSLAKSQSKLLRYHGDVQFFCQEMEAADPITFTTRESFLVSSSHFLCLSTKLTLAIFSAKR